MAMFHLRRDRLAPSFEEDWRQRFREFAEKYDDDAGIAGWTHAGLEARLRHFTQVWQGDASASLWLDVGCGAGTYARYLAAHGLTAIGLDYSLNTIMKAQARSPATMIWLVGNATALPVNDKSINGVLCFGVTQALTDSSSLIRELVRVLKPGSQLWIDGLNRRCLPHVWDRVKRRLSGKRVHLRYESPYRLRRMLLANGLCVEDLYWVPILPRYAQRFQAIIESSAVRFLLRRLPLIGDLFSHAFVLRATLCIAEDLSSAD